MISTYWPEWRKDLLNPAPESDNSSSTGLADGRKETLKAALDAIAGVYQLARDKGIVSVRFVNTQEERQDIKSNDVPALLEAIEYGGPAIPGTQLQEKILEPFVLNPKTPMKKPLLTVVITDGNVSSSRPALHCADHVSRPRANGGVF